MPAGHPHRGTGRRSRCEAFRWERRGWNWWRATFEYMRGHPEIRLVRFVLFGAPAFAAYESALAGLFPDRAS